MKAKPVLMKPGTRRLRVLAEARKAYERLKRRNLVIDVSIWPDRSSEVVAILAVFAVNVHQYLKRAERKSKP